MHVKIEPPARNSPFCHVIKLPCTLIAGLLPFAALTFSPSWRKTIYKTKDNLPWILWRLKRCFEAVNKVLIHPNNLAIFTGTIWKDNDECMMSVSEYLINGAKLSKTNQQMRKRHVIKHCLLIGYVAKLFSRSLRLDGERTGVKLRCKMNHREHTGQSYRVGREQIKEGKEWIVLPLPPV